MKIKKYFCICPVCRSITVLETEFFGGVGIINNFPTMPCPKKHKANEVRAKIGLKDLPCEQGEKLVKGATRMATHEEIESLKSEGKL